MQAGREQFFTLFLKLSCLLSTVSFSAFPLWSFASPLVAASGRGVSTVVPVFRLLARTSDQETHLRHLNPPHFRLCSVLEFLWGLVRIMFKGIGWPPTFTQSALISNPYPLCRHRELNINKKYTKIWRKVEKSGD
jgi:hypothetical protein